MPYIVSINRVVGQHLRERRELLGISVDDLASELGISKPRLQGLERGAYNVKLRPHEIVMLGQVLGGLSSIFSYTRSEIEPVDQAYDAEMKAQDERDRKKRIEQLRQMIGTAEVALKQMRNAEHHVPQWQLQERQQSLESYRRNLAALEAEVTTND